jgi:Arc-like DNA binding domain
MKLYGWRLSLCQDLLFTCDTIKFVSLCARQWEARVAQKDQELRPVMTRIPEGLRRRLERQAKWHRRSMNAEIVHRLQESFDIPDHAGAIASDVASEISTELDGVSSGLNEIKSQNRAILSHLGLPDPVEEAKARKAEARKAATEAGRADLERWAAEVRKADVERRAANRPETGPSAETKDGEQK